MSRTSIKILVITFILFVLVAVGPAFMKAMHHYGELQMERSIDMMMGVDTEAPSFLGVLMGKE